MADVDSIFHNLVLAAMLVLAAFQVRYYARRIVSWDWPKATATVKQGFAGTILKTVGAGFFQYVFTVEGVEYWGRFILPDNRNHVEKLQLKLDGRPLLVKFRPSNPRVSLLADFNDPLFEGLVATQNPYWYMDVRDRGSILSLDLNKK